LLGAAVAGVLIGGVAYFSWSGAKAPATSASATPSATVSVADAQVTASVEQPAASATATAEAAADVDIEILSVQPGTEVLLAGNKIGNAPGMVHVPRGDKRVMLTLRARGYRDLEVELTPDRNRTLTPPPMIKQGGRPVPATPKKADKTELEDPGL
jgi:hypothetical protein